MGLILAGQRSYSIDEAHAVIAGYVLADAQLRWTPPPGSAFGDPPGERTIPRWAYRTYDTIPGSVDERGGPIDILVAAGLNARIDSKAFAAAQAIWPETSEALAQIPEDATLWELSRKELKDPPPDSHSWWLHRAWWLLEGAREIGIARAHKILHHKRPNFAPLVDGKTVVPLRRAAKKEGNGGDYWLQIHAELVRYKAEFDDLEHWSKGLEGMVAPIGRLRLHDILLWCRVVPEQDKQARLQGDKLLSLG